MMVQGSNVYKAPNLVFVCGLFFAADLEVRSKQSRGPGPGPGPGPKTRIRDSLKRLDLLIVD